MTFWENPLKDAFGRLEDWTKTGYTFGELFEDVKKITPGVLPRAKGMPLEDIIRQEARVIGGYPREAVGGLWEGVTGKVPSAPGVSLIDRWGKFWEPRIPTVEQVGGIIPEVPEIKFPEIPEIKFPEIRIPEFPTIPEFPKIDIRMPEIPGVPKLTDEEGKIQPAVLIGAAAVGLGGLYLLTKGR